MHYHNTRTKWDQSVKNQSKQLSVLKDKDDTNYRFPLRGPRQEILKFKGDLGNTGNTARPFPQIKKRRRTAKEEEKTAKV